MRIVGCPTHNVLIWFWALDSFLHNVGAGLALHPYQNALSSFETFHTILPRALAQQAIAYYNLKPLFPAGHICLLLYLFPRPSKSWPHLIVLILSQKNLWSRDTWSFLWILTDSKPLDILGLWLTGFISCIQRPRRLYPGGAARLLIPEKLPLHISLPQGFLDTFYVLIP